jgi:predicted nucleic acid-binding protein
VKRLLLDVNVLLDALLERRPHAAAAARLWNAAEGRRVAAFVPAHGVTTLFYLLGRQKGALFARSAVGGVLGVFSVAAVDQAAIQRALALGWADFEDAVCAAAAEAAGCDAIVTDDPKGFPDASLPVLSPEAAVALLEEPPPDRVAERDPGYLTGPGVRPGRERRRAPTSGRRDRGRSARRPGSGPRVGRP